MYGKVYITASVINDMHNTDVLYGNPKFDTTSRRARPNKYKNNVLAFMPAHIKVQLRMFKSFE